MSAPQTHRARRPHTVVAELDRTLMAAVARSRSPLLDVVLPRLGTAADGSRLWMGVAAALGASGRPRARRAAVRGMGCVGLASVAANIAAKSLTRRTRPPAEVTPLVRRLRRRPPSTSFPSGHAAAAAAFTTGVALEAPALAVPVGLLAAGVAASRVVTGVHYPSDVAAGAALGAGLAALSPRWWPRRPDGPADGAPPRSEAPASATGEGVVVVVNVAAGGDSDGVADAVRRCLPDAELVACDEGTDVAGSLADAAGRAKVLGVAGGDGTVNAAARVAARAGLPLLVVPAGTLNHFAREVGVCSAEEAFDALRDGEAVAVDLGVAGERVFLNTASTGVYADLVHAREQLERRIGKWPALVVGLVRVLHGSAPRDVVVDGSRRRVWLLFAGNCRYRPDGFAPSYRPRLDDGLLDVRLVDADPPLARLRLVLALLTGTLGRSRVHEARTATSVELESVDGDLRLTVDGELVDTPHRVVLAKRERTLLVYRPAQL